MRHRGSRDSMLEEIPKKDRTYMRFAGEAFDFNEQNRILRSICLYNAITRDPSVVLRFEEIIEQRKDRNI